MGIAKYNSETYSFLNHFNSFFMVSQDPSISTYNRTHGIVYMIILSKQVKSQNVIEGNKKDKYLTD